MASQKHGNKLGLVCALWLCVCMFPATAAYGLGGACSVQIFQPNDTLPTPPGWTPPANGSTQPTPPLNNIRPARTWAAIDPATSYFLPARDTEQQACADVIGRGYVPGFTNPRAKVALSPDDLSVLCYGIYQGQFESMYTSLSAQTKCPSGYGSVLGTSNPNWNLQFGSASNGLCAADALYSVSSLGTWPSGNCLTCRLSAPALVKKPSDGICNMIAQGNTFVPDTGGGVNGGDPDCPCAVQCLPPNVINQTGQCEPPETYKLTLTPNSATIEPGQRTTFTVTVTKQDGSAPSKDVPVNISLKVEATSGGHTHGDSTRPRGGINNTPCASDATCKTLTIPAGTTTATFNFNSTDAAGTHTITASCDKCTNGAQSADVTVKVDGLWPIFKAPTLYAFVGGESDKPHHDNHYLTSNASNQLTVIAINYHFLYPNDPVLHLNDASLKWGGKFDIKGNWKGDHRGHKRGAVIDIRANSINEGTSSIPERLFAKFEKMASETKKTFPGGEVSATAKLHCSQGRDPAVDNCVGDDNRHYHVILLGVDQ